MQRRPLALTGAGLALLLALTGCQSDGVASTPPPSISPILPTAQQTTASSATTAPSVTPTPTPTSPLITVRPTTSADMETLAQEAEQLYIEYKTLRLKYEANGGIDGPLPEDLKKYVTGEAAEGAEAVLNHVHKAGTRLERIENLRLVRLGTFMTNLEPESLIGLRMCDDGSKLIHVSADGTRKPAAILRYWSEFTRGPEGRLIILYSEVEEVDSCDA